jgi:hypothetical protein
MTSEPAGTPDSNWATLRTGLRIVDGGAIAGCAGLVAFGLGSSGMLLAVNLVAPGRAASSGPGAFLFWIMLSFAGVLAVYSQLVVMLTGWTCCRAAPPEIGQETRTWSTLAVIGGAGGIAAVFGVFILPQLGLGFDASAMMMNLIMFVSTSAVLAGYACFGGFVRGLAEYFRDSDLRVRSLYFTLYVGAFGCWILLQTFFLGEDSGRLARGTLFPRREGSGFVALFSNIAAGIVLFLWLRDLARKAARNVDFHIRSM